MTMSTATTPAAAGTPNAAAAAVAAHAAATATMTAADRPVSAKLIAPRGEAIAHLHHAIDRGTEILNLRIRNGEELDKARGHKLEWVGDVTVLLNNLFDNPSVADYVNDWVGKVFPEYAEFGNFVEQFFEEMDFRLTKLRTVLKRVEQAGETPNPNRPPAADPSTSNAAPTAASSPSLSPQISESQMPSAAVAHASNSSNKVLFVSNGTKDAAGEAVIGFLQALSLPVSEADHTNGLIDTLETRTDTGFIVVMNAETTNGSGNISESSVFKLGYCAGKLGLKRMCMVHTPQHASSGESHGIAHVSIDNNGGWQLHLARQMKRAGLDIDLNRLM
jgi:hypothetical protein